MNLQGGKENSRKIPGDPTEGQNIYIIGVKYISAGFSNLMPSLAFIVGMATSFYTNSQAMTFIPLSIAYAIWSGLGTVLTALIAILFWKEPANIYTGIGIALIISGVVLLHLKSHCHSVESQ